MRIAIIGGSGFGTSLVDGVSETVDTQFGQASITRGKMDRELEIIFVARHGPGHTLPPHLINHRANIAALQILETDVVYATAAVGSLRAEYAPGDFVVVNDFIDMTKGGVTTFYDASGAVRHTDMSETYSNRLRDTLLASADPASEVHSIGTYLCVSGPRYETPAEVRLFAQWGADVVGMTGAPEAILSREIGLPYASVAIVTNYACGLLTTTPLSHAEVEDQMTKSRETLKAWLFRAIKNTY